MIAAAAEQIDGLSLAIGFLAGAVTVLVFRW